VIAELLVWEYCDDLVCLVCLSIREHMSVTMHWSKLHRIFHACYTDAQSSSDGVVICYVGLLSIFTARRYAIAVYATTLCLCVRPFVTSRSSIETDERIEMVFGMGASFDLSYAVL